MVILLLKLYESMCECSCPWIQDAPGTRVAWVCELADVSIGNRTQILCKTVLAVNHHGVKLEMILLPL